jgi:four helix bundle protein
MAKTELEDRTKHFALDVIRFVGSLPKGPMTDILGRQLLGSATSIGANYREANRAESRADFIHKIAIVEKECAETCYWLELFQESRAVAGSVPGHLVTEANELLAIFVAIGKRTKAGISEDMCAYDEATGRTGG